MNLSENISHPCDCLKIDALTTKRRISVDVKIASKSFLFIHLISLIFICALEDVLLAQDDRLFIEESANFKM